MTIEVSVVAGLVLVLAWTNGANDVAKGIATPTGSAPCRAMNQPVAMVLISGRLYRQVRLNRCTGQ